MRGAAVGTIFARCSELVMVLIYMYFRENTVGFRMHDCLKFDREMLPSYNRHSLPVLGKDVYKRQLYGRVQQYFAILASLFLPPDPTYLPNIFTDAVVKPVSYTHLNLR